jgi:hypothetical protein
VAVRRRSVATRPTRRGAELPNAEVAVEQLARRGAGKGDAVVGLEKHDGCPSRLVEGERLTEAPSSLTSAVKLHEVGVTHCY